MIVVFCFLMIRRPPRSTLDRSSAASDVYKRQVVSLSRLSRGRLAADRLGTSPDEPNAASAGYGCGVARPSLRRDDLRGRMAYSRLWRFLAAVAAVSYTHLRAHETVLDLVCRLLLEKKKT